MIDSAAGTQHQQLLEKINKMSLLIDLYPKREINYLYRGKAFSDLGRYEEAISDYTKALELNPKNYNTFTNRGNTLYYFGKKEEAILDYSQAISLRPFEKKNYYNRGRLVNIFQGKALFDLGRKEESIMTKQIFMM